MLLLTVHEATARERFGSQSSLITKDLIPQKVPCRSFKPERGTFIKYSNLIMNALRFSDLPGPGLGILQETEYLLLKYGIKREKVLNRTSSSAARHFLLDL